MFEYIKGTLIQLTPTAAVIETGGVGWFVNISLHTQSNLQQLGIGSEVKILLYQHYVQDQAPLLFGFCTDEERQMFKLLLTVKGVGASSARIMLSTYSPSVIAKYILTGNVRAIQKAKGIGLKTAEQIVVELKSKVATWNIDGVEVQSSSVSSVESEALAALTVLGFAQTAAQKVVHRIFIENPAVTVEDLIRRSLSAM